MIDQAMVQSLANAARIDLAAEEITRLASQLSDILEQLAPLMHVEGDDAPGAVTDHAQSLRADVVDPDPMTGGLNRFAPDMREGFFTVPLLPSHRGGDAS